MSTDARPASGEAAFSLRRFFAPLSALAMAFASPTQAAIDATLLGPVGGAGVARGVVVIRCGEDVVYQTRGAVLDVGSADDGGDIVLTTAHGLPETIGEVLRSCRVHGVAGRPYRVREVWRGSEPDFAGDWAVLRLKKRLAGDVARLAIGRVSGQSLTELVNQHATIRLLLRQADPIRGDCELLPLTPTSDLAWRGLIVYSCKEALGFAGAPGLSGSPLLLGAAGRTVVVAVHVGWALRMSDDGRLHAVSMGVPIDAEMAAAIAAAAAR